MTMAWLGGFWSWESLIWLMKLLLFDNS